MWRLSVATPVPWLVLSTEDSAPVGSPPVPLCWKGVCQEMEDRVLWSYSGDFGDIQPRELRLEDPCVTVGVVTGECLSGTRYTYQQPSRVTQLKMELSYNLGPWTLSLIIN